MLSDLSYGLHLYRLVQCRLPVKFNQLTNLLCFLVQNSSRSLGDNQ